MKSLSGILSHKTFSKCNERCKGVMGNNIIFIEGVSGVGKTTTAAHLHDCLQNIGHDTIFHLEGDPDNPLDPFKGKYPSAMPITSFTEAYLHCWQNFRDSYVNKNTLILDGTLLHHQINDLVRNYNASNETILGHLTVLLQITQQLNPVIFYLSSIDIRQRLIDANGIRKKPVPTVKQVAFWEKRKHIDLYVLDRLPIKSHVLNVDSGWDAAIETMIKCITLPAFEA